jgi:hypothetical protein
MTLAADEPPILFLAHRVSGASLHGLEPGHNQRVLESHSCQPFEAFRSGESAVCFSPDAVFEASPHFADSVEKKLRTHRCFEVRRCETFDVGWALKGNVILPRHLSAFAGSDYAIVMLYSLTVEEDSVNRPKGWVGGRGLGPGDWASTERTTLLLFGPSEGHPFRETSPLSRNSRWFNAHSSGSTSAGEPYRMSRGSAAHVSRPDSPSIQGWQGLSGPSRGLPGTGPPQRSGYYGR